MTEIHITQNCGIDEILGIQFQDPEDTIGEIFKNGAPPVAGFIFSDNIDCYDGNRLMKYIHKMKYGKVTKIPMGVNPNTGNKISLYVWKTNKTFYRAYDKWLGL